MKVPDLPKSGSLKDLVIKHDVTNDKVAEFEAETDPYKQLVQQAKIERAPHVAALNPLNPYDERELIGIE